LKSSAISIVKLPKYFGLIYQDIALQSQVWHFLAIDLHHEDRICDSVAKLDLDSRSRPILYAIADVCKELHYFTNDASVSKKLDACLDIVPVVLLKLCLALKRKIPTVLI